MQVEITQEVEKMIKEALKIVEILKEKTNSKIIQNWLKNWDLLQVP